MGRPKHDGNERVKLVGAANFYSFINKNTEKETAGPIKGKYTFPQLNLVMPRLSPYPSLTEEIIYYG